MKGARTATLNDVLGPLGTLVVREILAQGEATVGEVQAALQRRERRPIGYTTVMTVMVRLTDRRLITRERRGRRFVYRPVLAEAELIEELSRRAVDIVIDRYGSAAIRHFAARLTDLDPELRRELLDLAAVDE